MLCLCIVFPTSGSPDLSWLHWAVRPTIVQDCAGLCRFVPIGRWIGILTLCISGHTLSTSIFRYVPPSLSVQTIYFFDASGAEYRIQMTSNGPSSTIDTITLYIPRH